MTARPLRCRVGTVAAGAFAAALLLAGTWVSSAHAMNIQRVVSPGGIEAWLVEHREGPLVAMRFAFGGGSAHDPDGKEGLANFLSGMLDEGAGEMDATAFQERAEELGLRLDFDAHRDVFTGSLQTLTENRQAGFEMLRLALNEPRFDDDAVERIRSQIVAGLRFDMNDPQRVAVREWYRIAFPDHPYGRPSKGTFDSVAAITGADLKGLAGAMFARDTLKVAVVGDIDAETLGPALDRIFGGLPAGSDMPEISEAEPPFGPARKVVEMNVPQSVALFGHRGLKRRHEDFIPAFVLNYILGGGGFSSRLMEEVRDERGLAYSISSHLQPFQWGAVLIGSVATENKAVGESLAVIEAEIARMMEDGPTEQELMHAKQYLTGSYALRFDTSGGIANQLLWVQIEDLGIDYIDKRNDLIEAVTLDEVRRIASELLAADRLIVTIVGNPEMEAEKAG